MSANDLIQRASHGTITANELATVAKSLESDQGDSYDYLLILGRAGATQYRNLVEQFLCCEEDAMLTRLALQVLCRYWGLAEEYASEIMRFVLGVDWDEDDDVRIMAISCSDSLIASPKYVDLLTEIYRITTDSDEDDLTRQAAYAALAISNGVQPVNLPSPAKFKIDSDMDVEILEKVKLRLSN